VTAFEELAYFASLIWERHLANTAGGNLSVRGPGETCYITRSRNNRDQQWRVTEESILHVGLDGEILAGEGAISREFRVHLGLYRRFSGLGAVIHAHPRYATAYAALARPLEPVLESSDKFGTIPCLAPTLKSLTEEYAEAALTEFERQRERAETIGFAVLYPRHGVTTAGPTMVDAFDLLERIEDNAVAALWTSLLGGHEPTPASAE
jgi:L-fuculose-phosphate aldolase